MAKRKLKQRAVKATEREQRLQRVATLQNELNSLRGDMLANVATWSHGKMGEALTRASNINKELKKLVP